MTTVPCYSSSATVLVACWWLLRLRPARKTTCACASTAKKAALTGSEVRRTGAAYLSAAARHNSRIPPGHPEGYLEAFANLYRNFALTLLAEQGGPTAPSEAQDYPGIEEGLRGMAFIENVIASGRSEQKWTKFTV
jgi:hypothetical protein